MAAGHFISWVTVIWAMTASACLVLALIHLRVWWRRRDALAHALFALMAVSTTFSACCELWMMWSASVVEFGAILRWLHVPAWILIIATVGFVRLYLRAGRPWLAWTVCGVRTLSLILDFSLHPNINYRVITALDHIPFLGEPVSVAVGVPSPWMLVGQLSLLLFVVFNVDAALSVRRRGDRRTAWLLGGSIAFFAAASTGQIILSLWGIVPMPLTISLFFLAIVAAMGFELSDDMLRAVQLSDELRESEERLGLAADAAGAGFWSWDFRTGRIWATEKARTLYGFGPSEEIAYSTFLGRIHPDDRERVHRDAQRAFQEAADFRSEYRVLLPDGDVRWIKAQARVVPNPQGGPDRMMGVAIDISLRKQQEGETASLRFELVHLGRVLSMSELSTTLAHEINQPLGAILNNASAAALLLHKARDNGEEIDMIVADIIQDAKRAGDVIRKVRGIVRKAEVNFEPLHVNTLIGEVVALFQNTIGMNGVTVQITPNPELPRVRGDRVRLQQVLVNLFSNAMDAMRDSSAKTLTFRSALEAPGLVTVSVSDSGTGLDPAVKDRVFTPFVTTRKDGLGMGLRICRTIIEEHGGRIWAENNPDAGAVFHFSLRVWSEETA